MPPSSLLYLRSGAPGLPGPYLQENLAPYRIMDEMGAQGHKIALAIGGEAKRRFLATSRPLQNDYAVALLKLDRRTLVLDCEMHLQPDSGMPRILGGPRPGHYDYHLVNSPPRTATQLAFGLYCDVFSIFSDLVLIFVADFGGVEQVLSFLCFWMRCAKAKRYPRQSQVILVSDDMDTTAGFDEFRLMAAMISQLRTDEPATPHSVADVKGIIRRCFDFTLVRGTAELCDEFWLDITASTVPLGGAMDLSPLRKRALFRAAIAQYARQPSLAFNAILASRIPNPLPKEFEENLVEFLDASRVANADNSCLVASALVMDAFPPTMHSKSRTSMRRFWP